LEVDSLRSTEYATVISRSARWNHGRVKVRVRMKMVVDDIDRFAKERIDDITGNEIQEKAF
jgi:hypothetical protein